MQQIRPECEYLVGNAHTWLSLTADAKVYHHISDNFHCTDGFLASLLAELMNPDTKGATKRVAAPFEEPGGLHGVFLHSEWGGLGNLIDALINMVFEMPECLSSRNAAAKRLMNE